MMAPRSVWTANRPSRSRRTDVPGEPLARVDDPSGVDGQAAVVGPGTHLVGDALERDNARRGSPLGPRPNLGREVAGIPPRPRELHIAIEPELGVDAAVPD